MTTSAMPGTSPPASHIPSKQALLRSVQAASPLAAFFVPGCGTRPGLPTLPGREACPKAGLLSRIICPISGPRCRYPSGAAWHTGRSGRCPAPGPSCAYCPRWPSGHPAGSPLRGIAGSLPGPCPCREGPRPGHCRERARPATCSCRPDPRLPVPEGKAAGLPAIWYPRGRC